MTRHRMRLGPVAVLLTIVVIVITMLAILTVSTSRADLVMAERFAALTQIRYELEAEGERFLAAAASDRLEGMRGVTESEDDILYSSERDGYRLEIRITIPDSQGGFEIVDRRMSKIWNNEDPVTEIWQGQEERN